MTVMGLLHLEVTVKNQKYQLFFSSINSFKIDLCIYIYYSPLQEGQYTSVYIENGSSNAVTVLEGSDFSGILVGT